MYVWKLNWKEKRHQWSQFFYSIFMSWLELFIIYRQEKAINIIQSFHVQFLFIRLFSSTKDRDSSLLLQTIYKNYHCARKVNFCFSQNFSYQLLFDYFSIIFFSTFAVKLWNSVINRQWWNVFLFVQAFLIFMKTFVCFTAIVFEYSRLCCSRRDTFSVCVFEEACEARLSWVKWDFTLIWWKSSRGFLLTWKYLRLEFFFQQYHRIQASTEFLDLLEVPK